MLTKVLDPDLFAEYIKGHLPTIAKFGGKVVFRSIENIPIQGGTTWDAIAMQEWPDSETFEKWWNSEEYRPWAEIREKAAQIQIIRCNNLQA